MTWPASTTMTKAKRPTARRAARRHVARRGTRDRATGRPRRPPHLGKRVLHVLRRRAAAEVRWRWRREQRCVVLLPAGRSLGALALCCLSSSARFVELPPHIVLVVLELVVQLGHLLLASLLSLELSELCF